MRAKLLAIDLDGTLLGRDGIPHEADRAALARLFDAGIPATIITGRLYSGTRHVARAVGIEGPIACVDGSHIVDTRSEGSLFSRAIRGDDAVSLRDIVASHDAASFLFAQDIIVHDDRGAPFVQYVRTWSPVVAEVERVADHPHWEHEEGVHAVVSVGPTAQILACAASLRETLAHAAIVIDFPVARLVGAHALVARASGATKGTAVEWLARHHGCAPSEVVAVGDWINDVPMFRVAGRSFVMGQAPDAVKDAATDRLAETVFTGGGVAAAIRTIWGI